MSGTPIETERKFLIRMPSFSTLQAQNGVRIKEIKQTYLVTDNGTNARVREIVENGKVSRVKTIKKRISSLSCYEDEGEITKEQYEAELTLADPSKKAIEKVRYAFPFGSHTVEIDVFPFWSDRALLEVELESENEEFDIPDFVEIIKEVSNDPRYKNTNLATNIPMDII